MSDALAFHVDGNRGIVAAIQCADLATSTRAKYLCKVEKHITPGRDLVPHGLRRTYAQIGCDAGEPITQISKMMDHASMATMQRHLNLETVINDFMPV